MFENLADFYSTFGPEYIADRMSRGWGPWSLQTREDAPEGWALVHGERPIELDVTTPNDAAVTILTTVFDVSAADCGYALAGLTDSRWARHLALGPWARTGGAE